jgi:hypothetical protein
VGPRNNLFGANNLTLTGIRSPDRPVRILTELSRPTLNTVDCIIIPAYTNGTERTLDSLFVVFLFGNWNYCIRHGCINSSFHDTGRFLLSSQVVIQMQWKQTILYALQKLGTNKRYKSWYPGTSQN